MSRMWNRRDLSGRVMPNIGAPGLLILVVIVGIPVLIPRPTLETPAGASGYVRGATTLTCTRIRSHERGGGSVASVASVAAEKVEDAQRRGGREEQPLRRFGLGRSMVVR